MESRIKQAHGYVIATVLLAAQSMAGEKISLYYNERVPYLETQANGDVQGLTATPAKLVFQRAGIPFEWKKSSVTAQLLLIRENQRKGCLVGWYKNPEREKLGKFSHPIYQGRLTIALGLADNPKIGSEQSPRELLQNKQTTLLVKEGYSYGHILDIMIAQTQPRISVATGENINMLSMLVYKRADYFFVGEFEALELIRHSEYTQKDFKLMRFAEPLPEEPRHLWCSKQVPDDVIDKLNVEIDKLKIKQ